VIFPQSFLAVEHQNLTHRMRLATDFLEASDVNSLLSFLLCLLCTVIADLADNAASRTPSRDRRGVTQCSTAQHYFQNHHSAPMPLGYDEPGENADYSTQVKYVNYSTSLVNVKFVKDVPEVPYKKCEACLK
jgi:hypothetical protein